MPWDDNNTRALAGIFPDRPVTGAEGLDFQSDGLVRTLADLAWNPDNPMPFTALIRSGWGRSKTTLLRQTERLLREAQHGEDRRAVRPVCFNAWTGRYQPVEERCAYNDLFRELFV